MRADHHFAVTVDHDVGGAHSRSEEACSDSGPSVGEKDEGNEEKLSDVRE